ncbi:alpha/beta hydrolase [Roseicyclus marinus]|uniref:alpha/beta hydrolase n=1 Tax=Roseicyclus marinus TaxID=2161673 RepID=UPI0024101A24|nr:alpha/beta hydrolase [Roseicyclus marinus]MDG3040809.1 alpha/beta hydrolase [Roseicyclus marinus]
MSRKAPGFAWAFGVALVLALGFAVLPRERVEVGALPDFEDAAAFLAAREGAYDDIRPGEAARIVWAGEEGAVTPLSIVYLHGFSAGTEEIRPVPDRVAEALGANLIYARLAGHGRSGAAMAEARAGDWVQDTALFLEIGRRLGERVLVIGTSTGGTLAAWAMSDPAMALDVAGVVLVSPNFAVANRAGFLLEQPLARHWIPLVAGAERRFEPLNAGQAAHWTTQYPTVATVSLGTLLRELRARDLGAAVQPVLVLFADSDRVVSAPATRAAMARWGGPVTLAPVSLPGDGADPFHHVIAGDILSPAMTDEVVQTILDWAEVALAD